MSINVKALITKFETSTQQQTPLTSRQSLSSLNFNPGNPTPPRTLSRSTSLNNISTVVPKYSPRWSYSEEIKAVCRAQLHDELDSASAAFRGITQKYIASKKVVDVNAPILNSNGQSLDNITLLHLAASGSDSEHIHELIGLKADVNAKMSSTKYTPLHYAVDWGWGNHTTLHNKLDNIKTLLDAGADPALKDMQGRTPLDIAVEILIHPARYKNDPTSNRVLISIINEFVGRKCPLDENKLDDIIKNAQRYELIKEAQSHKPYYNPILFKNFDLIRSNLIAGKPIPELPNF